MLIGAIQINSIIITIIILSSSVSGTFLVGKSTGQFYMPLMRKPLHSPEKASVHYWNTAERYHVNSFYKTYPCEVKPRIGDQDVK